MTPIQKIAAYKAQIADIEDFLDDLTDAEDIFLSSLKTQIRRFNGVLEENKMKRLEFIWQRVVKQRVKN